MGFKAVPENGPDVGDIASVIRLNRSEFHGITYEVAATRYGRGRPGRGRRMSQSIMSFSVPAVVVPDTRCHKGVEVLDLLHWSNEFRQVARQLIHLVISEYMSVTKWAICRASWGGVLLKFKLFIL